MPASILQRVLLLVGELGHMCKTAVGVRCLRLDVGPSSLVAWCMLFMRARLCVKLKTASQYRY